MSKKELLVWVDLETTGLDNELINDNGHQTIGSLYHRIMEIAVVVTDKDLNIIGEGLELIIKMSDDDLSRMIPWAEDFHGKSGLTEECKNSNLTLKDAEQEVLSFLKEKGVSLKLSPLCGNSIRLDRNFIAAQMPEFEDFLHYRQLDVSTPKILSQLWFPELQKKVKKKLGHRALGDILESIEELKFYKESMLVKPKNKIKKNNRP
jgi:oligoribonuclease